ncbi:class I SAM-dependent methyltransferase [Kineococcus sp. NUM-3379]
MQAPPPVVPPSVAARWIDRWDRQQERYALDRGARARAVADVVAHAVGGSSDALVVDLGAGPGSLARTVAARVPAASVVAVDRDPFLLALGTAHDGWRIRYVEAFLGAPGWVRAVAGERPWDAAVTATCLHYPPRGELARIYRDVAAALRPGGLLVNADHLPDAPGALADLAAAVEEGAASRARRDGEDWSAWWQAARADPDLAPALAARDGAPAAGGENGLTLADHEGLLREAGFRDTGVLWQVGTSRVLVAVR